MTSPHQQEKQRERQPAIQIRSQIRSYDLIIIIIINMIADATSKISCQQQQQQQQQQQRWLRHHYPRIKKEKKRQTMGTSMVISKYNTRIVARLALPHTFYPKPFCIPRLFPSKAWFLNPSWTIQADIMQGWALSLESWLCIWGFPNIEGTNFGSPSGSLIVRIRELWGLYIGSPPLLEIAISVGVLFGNQGSWVKGFGIGLFAV